MYILRYIFVLSVYFNFVLGFYCIFNHLQPKLTPYCDSIDYIVFIFILSVSFYILSMSFYILSISFLTLFMSFYVFFSLFLENKRFFDCLFIIEMKPTSASFSDKVLNRHFQKINTKNNNQFQTTSFFLFTNLQKIMNFF